MELGLGELGFADHSPMPAKFDAWRMGIEDLPRYLESVAEVREQFPHLADAEVIKRAQNARKAFYADIQLKAAKARSERAAGKK